MSLFGLFKGFKRADALPPVGHDKAFQLGYEPVDNGDPEFIAWEDADLDAVWADATTVEQFAADLELLGQLPADEVEALRLAREGS